MLINRKNIATRKRPISFDEVKNTVDSFNSINEFSNFMHLLQNMKNLFQDLELVLPYIHDRMLHKIGNWGWGTSHFLETVHDFSIYKIIIKTIAPSKKDLILYGSYIIKEPRKYDVRIYEDLKEKIDINQAEILAEWFHWRSYKNPAKYIDEHFDFIQRFPMLLDSVLAWLKTESNNILYPKKYTFSDTITKFFLDKDITLIDIFGYIPWDPKIIQLVKDLIYNDFSLLDKYKNIPEIQKEFYGHIKLGEVGL